jgi:hypothetical protein
MPVIDVDDRTYSQVRFAARMAGLSDAEVVARAVDAYVRSDEGRPVQDPWEPVPVYAEYGDLRVEALYLPANQRVTVTTDPVAGQTFRSPSGAARAVVTAVNPTRNATQTNGWRFWHVAATGDRLEALRRRRRKAPATAGT